MTDKDIPAFPTVMLGEIEGGMTLRDYFAAKAMQTILSKYDNKKIFEPDEVFDPEGVPAIIALDAYIMADLMLRERNIK
jgi:hypothetical protein